MASKSITWRVVSVDKSKRKHVAKLIDLATDDTSTRPVDDLIVVADFRDPIYPGLRSTGTVERGGDKPFHAVVNAENFHALEALAYAYPGKVDAIYVDPPYNTRDKDWKYNNDYVDSDDEYKHSKWLSMIERRLKVAKQLLNPADSVLIVTIDEKEYLRLGLLLEQTFPSARIQMVSILINPANVARKGGFGRSDEYAFFVMLGDASPQRVELGPEWVSTKGRTFTGTARWDLLRRSGTNAQREDRPKLFYPIYVDPKTRRVMKAGDSIDEQADHTKIRVPRGLVAVWPIRKDLTHGNWQLGQTALMSHVEEGRVRLGGDKDKGFVVYYMKGGEYEKVMRGDYPVQGRANDGSLIVGGSEATDNLVVPGTQWHIAAHDSTQYGSRLLAEFIPQRKFPFPKSLYAVEDALRFFVANKPDALILDFFAGSGTTAHAVCRLNRQDNGQRRAIVITNNEVSAKEAAALAKRKLRPGDAKWEEQGICECVTKPRLRAAITGETHLGKPVRGEYKFVDEFAMSEGFEENIEFFDLTYLDPDHVRMDLAFEAISPLLWMRAGGRGRRISKPVGDFDFADTYAVLFDVDAAARFLELIADKPEVEIVFIVADDDVQYQTISGRLPERIETHQLYASYLTSFEINTIKD